MKTEEERGVHWLRTPNAFAFFFFPMVRDLLYFLIFCFAEFCTKFARIQILCFTFEHIIIPGAPDEAFSWTSRILGHFFSKKTYFCRDFKKAEKKIKSKKRLRLCIKNIFKDNISKFEDKFCAKQRKKKKGKSQHVMLDAKTQIRNTRVK